MNKILQTAFLVLSILFSVNVASQETYTVFGVRGAIGMSNLKGIDDYAAKGWIPGTIMETDSPYRTAPSYAWDFGLTVQYVKNGLMIQGDYIFGAEANVKLKNANEGSTKVKRIRLYYNNLSVIGGTKIPLNENYRFVVGVGPYLGYDMVSWFTGRGGPPLLIDDILDGDEAEYRETDFGGILLAGIEVNNLQFAFNYQHGLVNVVRDEYAMYNRIYKLSVVYFF